MTLDDKTNALLKRREVKCIFKGRAGKLSRNDAVSLLSEQLKLNSKFVIPVTLKCETGKNDVRGTFYVYDDESLAKKHLPKYAFLRLLSKEERKKALEAAKAKAKAKKTEDAAPKEKEATPKEEKKEPEKAEAKPKPEAEEKPVETKEAEA